MPLNDTQKMHFAANKLLRWLQRWPDKGSAGKTVQTQVVIDGIQCTLSLTPTKIVDADRGERIKRYVHRKQS